MLFCVDGSAIATGALERACTVLAPGPAVALCVWLPAMVLHPRALDAVVELAHPAAEFDRASAREAGLAAETAAAIARAASFDCEARPCRGAETEWQEILAQAGALEASTIVIGSSGHSAVTERMLGGSAHRVLSHAVRPVLMVPPSATPARRQPPKDVARRTARKWRRSAACPPEPPRRAAPLPRGGLWRFDAVAVAIAAVLATGILSPSLVPRRER